MRISVQLVIFLLLLNGAAGAITASGTADALGVAPNPGGNEVSDIDERTGELSASSEANERTLFTLYTRATSAIQGIFQLAFYGPIMLENLGVPSWITGMFSGVISVVVFADVVYMLTGRDV